MAIAHRAQNVCRNASSKKCTVSKFKPEPEEPTAKHLFGGGMYEFTSSFDEEAWLRDAMAADAKRQARERATGVCRKNPEKEFAGTCSKGNQTEKCSGTVQIES
ncbi:hypothetical protein HY990_01890 [Candidatus Micrarchaeota archaeon]|nr:hypothetical protein [Candidatus Micrarchaeota archaeon]